jgi:hypothetical protein
VIVPRSPTCAAACLAEPCTLGQMRAAQRAAVTDPRITLWAELAVVGHLTGWSTPRSGPALTASLRAMDGRLRECAISHAVDAAVAARGPAISGRISPADLADHVTAAIHHVIGKGTQPCEAEEPRYLAPPYRWVLVRDALRTADREPGAGPHPRSAEWERDYGRPVPGDTAKAQLIAVTRWYLRDQRDSEPVAVALWGSRPRSGIERAVGAHAASDDWPARLTEALTAFIKLRWPLNYLLGPPAPANRAKPGSAQ